MAQALQELRAHQACQEQTLAVVQVKTVLLCLFSSSDLITFYVCSQSTVNEILAALRATPRTSSTPVTTTPSKGATSPTGPAAMVPCIEMAVAVSAKITSMVRVQIVKTPTLRSKGQNGDRKRDADGHSIETLSTYGAHDPVSSLWWFRQGCADAAYGLNYDTVLATFPTVGGVSVR